MVSLCHPKTKGSFLTSLEAAGQRKTGSPYIEAIDKLYTQMGKVDRRRNRVEPFAALCWALSIIHLALPAGPAFLHRRTQSKS